MITVVAALKAEVEPFLEKSAVNERVKLKQATLYRTPHVDFLRTGMGKVNARLALQRYLQFFKTESVLNIGTAGALHSNPTIGAVYCINRILYEQGETYFDLPLLNPIQCREKMGLLTVDEAVTANERRRTLNRRFGAELVDMEAFHLATVARAYDLSFYCIKAISDRAAEETSDEFKHYYRKVCRALADFVSPFMSAQQQ